MYPRSPPAPPGGAFVAWQTTVQAPTVRAVTGTSQQQALVALKALADARVLRQINEGSCNRQFAAVELFDLVTAYEERIAGRARVAEPDTT